MDWLSELNVELDRALILVAVFIAALMVTIIALAVSRRAGRNGKDTARPHALEETRHAASAEGVDDRNENPHVQADTIGGAAAGHHSTGATAAPQAGRTVTFGLAATAASDEGRALARAIDRATAAGAVENLPELNLSLAEWHLANGDAQQGEELLRSCVRGATECGLKGPHARARVLLGDIAQANGDPSTACEHWQIARMLFHEIGSKGAYDDVDVRMQRNGCPSDWVLTDF